MTLKKSLALLRPKGHLRYTKETSEEVNQAYYLDEIIEGELKLSPKDNPITEDELEAMFKDWSSAKANAE